MFLESYVSLHFLDFPFLFVNGLQLLWENPGFLKNISGINLSATNKTCLPFYSVFPSKTKYHLIRKSYLKILLILN